MAGDVLGLGVVAPLLDEGGVGRVLDRHEVVPRREVADEWLRVDPAKLDGVTDTEGGETIYLSVVDRDGNMVSLIQSIYSTFGSGVVAPGTGIVLQNRGSYFSLTPGHPNELAPGISDCPSTEEPEATPPSSSCRCCFPFWPASS